MRAKRAKAIRRAGRIAPPCGQGNASNRQLLGFGRKLLLIAGLMLIPISLMPEAWFGPINRVTALMVGNLLRLLPIGTVVHGNYVSVDGFSVTIIAECSAIHLFALYTAFVLAFPATRAEKWIGFAAGTAVLMALNIIRIAIVALVGRYFPHRFDLVHIYLGQLGMLVAMVVVCLLWCHWLADPGQMDRPIGFLIRFLIISSLPFLLWVPLNRLYIIIIDTLIQWLFSLVSLHLEMPHAHHLYSQTFSLIALGSLLMAAKGAGLAQRIRWAGIGFVVITLFQLAFRLCNLWITAFQMGWMNAVAQIVYNVCVYLLPAVIALLFLMQTSLQRTLCARNTPVG
ncbi:archaeosortase/exosortase family protein [Desulfosarcina ovata]|uniref:archaeosortase/exosortase family protein n=1 Tax=Desulfosarcina ovata TaxID=83564 RepID=UPI0012D2C556|nr:archaeosortase/exosortase family protein [Desulfosarcina ovata]